METIKRLPFTDSDKARVQSEAIASVETWPERHLMRYHLLDGAFNGRYIAADLFKETFAQYAATRESRARYSEAVHNASAVLSAELYRRVLKEPGPGSRAMLLTGIPGAGKTTSILVQGRMASDVKLVFEGQMRRPESTFPKLQQALDAGVEPVIVVVHPKPEFALRNTLRRFNELGRGAPIATMADIQGGLPDGLAAVRKIFGERVQLIVHDARDPDRRAKRLGWDNLSLLRSEGNREQIHQRLLAELERAEREGVAGVAHRQQALGEAPDARGVDRRVAPEDGGAGSQRDAQARDRAQAFLTLSPEEGVRRYPELTSAYEAAKAAELFAQEKLHSDASRSVFARKMREQIAERIAAGKAMLTVGVTAREAPEREL